jgi:hypothetical protein
VLRTPVRAPTANAFCERLGGGLRRECLDFLIPLHERHLQMISAAGARLYWENKHGYFNAKNVAIPVPARNIFAGLRDWPKTLFDFDSGTLRLAGISAVYRKLAGSYPFRPGRFIILQPA